LGYLQTDRLATTTQQLPTQLGTGNSLIKQIKQYWQLATQEKQLEVRVAVKSLQISSREGLQSVRTKYQIHHTTNRELSIAIMTTEGKASTTAGSRSNNNNGSSTTSSESFIAAALASQSATLLSVPEDPSSYVYPISAFPPLSEFELSFEYPSITAPARQVAKLRKSIKSCILFRPKFRVIHQLAEGDQVPKADDDPSNYRKVVLWNRPDIYDDPNIQALLNNEEKDDFYYCKSTHPINVSYSDWTADEVLRRLLPVEEIPSAFEIIGQLAHINLRDDLLPYKFIIGKVLLDKNAPRIKTIVNKIGNIATEFRTFGMEVIAGDENEGWSLVSVKEHGCAFTMDFRKVYWNSRLGNEHRRLVDIIAKDNNNRSSKGGVVVADLMAGIGPFAVPLAKRGICVHANDLNPSSYEYLVENKQKNKCHQDNNNNLLTCYNTDARAFCHQLQDEGIDFHHVLMNLPASAPEFLDAFRGFTGKSLPRIHVHCFGPKGSKESEEQAVGRCSKALGCPLDIEKVTVHLVRDVAPKKNMYCVSFDLPEETRALPRVKLQQETEEPESKRTKLN
jgi:tRNA (guanine37-N1)-methyltransferase